MNAFNTSDLPEPVVIEALDYETVFQNVQDSFIAQFPSDQAEAAAKGVPSQEAVQLLMEIEGNLVVKQLQAMAYHSLQLRARVNDAAKATMLSTATGADLDNLASFYAVTRKVLVEADPDAVPPVEEVLEADDDFRERIIISGDALSTAGPVGAYKFHALSADPDVKDVAIDSPTAGTVRVTVLSISNQGLAPAAVLTAVTDSLSAEDKRPLTDTVVVQAATVNTFAVDANVWFYDGADVAGVTTAAEEATQAYVDEMHRLGYDITDSGLKRALHQPGVQRVELVSPAANIVNGDLEASFCTGITINSQGFDT